MAPPRSRKKASTLNDELAALIDPRPMNFDPEAPDSAPSEEDEHSGSEDDHAALAREHYLSVGKSKLRRELEADALGEEYRGTRVKRDQLEVGDSEQDSGGEDDDVGGEGVEVYGSDSEIDSGDAMGSGDEERFAGYKFKGSRMTKEGIVPEKGARVTGSSSEDGGEESGSGGKSEGESDNEDQSDGTGSSSSHSGAEEEEDEAEIERRNALDALLAQEKTTTQRAQSTAATDAAKGRAILAQQKLYDQLLSARIKFQPALQATNSLISPSPSESSQALAAALSLWSSITTLRYSTLKRPHSAISTDSTEVDASAPLTSLWGTMESLNAAQAPRHNATIEKWAHKTSPVSTAPSSKLRADAPQHSITQSVSDSLTTDRERLISRTRTPRSAAHGDEESKELFDDTDFYGQLLRALVEARGAAVGELNYGYRQLREQKKRKKDVDTKASKGRKLRYQVHEKLVGFMAPVEGHDKWREEQADELFRSLLGRRVSVRPEEMDIVEEEGGGVRLFG